MIKMSDADSENLPFDTADLDGSASIVSSGEAALVNAARNGDRDAFGELYQRYERRVTRVIRRFVPDLEIASDLAQEAFLRAWERLDQFDPARRFGPWLFRLAVNLTYDSLRRTKRRGKWSLFSDAGDGSGLDPAAVDQQPDRDLAQEVQMVLEQVPEAYRIVLVLRELEGFCTSEVAAITERSEATVRWRLAEARRLFKEAWERRARSIEETQL